jgi:hypothetical protein
LWIIVCRKANNEEAPQGYQLKEGPTEILRKDGYTMIRRTLALDLDSERGSEATLKEQGYPDEFPSGVMAEVD